MVEQEAVLARLLRVQDNYTTYIENNSDGNPIYVGDAEPGTIPSNPTWRIKRITYDTDGNPTAIQWAGGSKAFKFSWTERITYTYI